MDISFDPTKNARNIDVHGVSLERVSEFQWETAFNVEDQRRDYGEQRFQAFGLIGSRVHVLIHTPREGRVHAISLRKANKREVRRFEHETQGKKSAFRS